MVCSSAALCGPPGYGRPVAVVWCPLDGKTIDGALAFAEGSWTREGVDAAWRAAGWAQPVQQPVSRLIYDEMCYTLGTGERLATLTMRFEPDEVIGVALDFATFAEQTDPEDEDVADLVEAVATAPGWQVDLGADRRSFDTVWHTGLREASARLGAPEAGGYLSEDWQYGVWRLDGTLLAVYQGEDFGSAGAMHAASLGLLRFPREEKVPDGERLYELLCGG